MAAPKTVATYDLNGSAREFDFSFDYLSRGFVQVSLIGAERQILTVGTDYTFVSATRIRTNVIYSPPEWTQIEIRRVTSTTERLVDFQDASILRADDLNLSDLQVLHVAEEAREAATETIGTNNFGHLDARGRRIVNVADPVEPGDSMTLRYYLADRNGTYAAKNAAEAARDKAKEWSTSPNAVEGTLRSSKTYAEQAGISADFSDQRATASASSATFSDQRATFSDQRATFSDQRATASANSASASAASSALALEYAQKPLDTPVSTGGYSALHWASKAEEWALQAGAVPVAVNQLTLAIRQVFTQAIGAPIPWPSDTIPAGYMRMEGQAIPLEYTILRQRYPSGYLPDMRDYFIRGKSASGRPVLSLEADANKYHAHSGTTEGAGHHNHHVNDPGHAHGYTYPGGVTNRDNGSVAVPTAAHVAGTTTYSGTGIWLNADGQHSHSFGTTWEGEAQARPKNIAFVYICMTDAAIPELPTIGA